MKIDGLADFPGINSSVWSAPWPRPSGTGSLEMLSPKKEQEILDTDEAASEEDSKDMFTERVPEDLGKTVCRIALLIYISKWIIYWYNWEFAFFITDAQNTTVEAARRKCVWKGDNCRSALQQGK